MYESVVLPKKYIVSITSSHILQPVSSGLRTQNSSPNSFYYKKWEMQKTKISDVELKKNNTTRTFKYYGYEKSEPK